MEQTRSNLKSLFLTGMQPKEQDFTDIMDSFISTTEDGLTIDVDNQRIGIGTATPASKLDVNGTLRSTQFVGGGSGLTNLNASAISSGTMPGTRIASLTASKLTGTLLTSVLPSTITVSTVKAKSSAGLKLYELGNKGIFIKNGGNVGIGNTIPGEKLHVTGNVKASYFKGDGRYLTALNGANISSGTISATRIAGLPATRITSGTIAAARLPGINQLSGTLAASQLSNNLIASEIKAASSSGLKLYEDGSKGIFIKDGGNVGIGSTSPAKKLHIGEAAGANLLLCREDTTTVTNDLLGRILFDTKDYLSTVDAPAMISAHSSETHGSGDAGGYLSFWTKATNTNYNVAAIERLRISDNGYVGIGTTSPAYKLDVAPDTNTPVRLGRSVIGNTGYSDYAAFGHTDKVSLGNYALLHGSTGETYLNASTGKNINFRENNITKMILRGGKLGVGTTIPKVRLHVYGLDSNDLSLANGTGILLIGKESAKNIVFDNNEIQARYAGSGSSLYLNVEGGKVYYGSGGIAQSSDRRLKKNIRNIEYGLQEVTQLRPVSYNSRTGNSSERYLGFIAQEVQPIINEVVDEDDTKEKMQSLSYVDMIPVLVNAIKELNAKVDGKTGTATNLARKATSTALSPKKPAVKTPAANKPTAKKATPKKPAAKKATPKKPAAKKATPKKPTAKKATTKTRKK